MKQLIDSSAKIKDFIIPEELLKTLEDKPNLQKNILANMPLNNIEELKIVVGLLAFSKTSTYMGTADMVTSLTNIKQQINTPNQNMLKSFSR